MQKLENPSFYKKKDSVKTSAAWQLQMFQKTLKKKLRLKEITGLIGSIRDNQTCLLITCGDNNGAMNYYLRQLGGKWFWAEIEDTSREEMSLLLEDEVKLVQPHKLPFADNSFDYVISIDVHEHLSEPQSLTQELSRVTKKDGKIYVTVPGDNEGRTIERLKNFLGMTKEKYGHVKEGFSINDLKAQMCTAQIKPFQQSTYSGFFTELVELTINFIYVNLLATRNSASTKQSTIAPQTRQQLDSIKKTYRMYSLLYPAFWLFSQLDKLLFFQCGYVVLVGGIKKV